MNSLLTERDAAVLTLTINRPERRNALDTATYDALAAQLRAADADTGLAAVILTGAGDHFTAGNDLRDFQAERAAGDSPAGRHAAAALRFRLRGRHRPAAHAVRGAGAV
ncbi:enoyl-CoA hydratase/isomerase family protein, partial [Bordetella pertussis]|uniref:enoyl-CoA hydratase/isomerase family protein n=1 Tax=Bordetella pertussis TaxID=520 RepID=UPI000A3E7125